MEITTGSVNISAARRWTAAGTHLTASVASFFPGLLLWFWAADHNPWLARQGKKSVILQIVVLLGFVITVPLFKFSKAAPHTWPGKHFSFAIGNAFTAHPVGAWFFVFGIIGFIVLCTVWTVITVIWISQALTGNKPPRAAAAE